MKTTESSGKSGLCRPTTVR